MEDLSNCMEGLTLPEVDETKGKQVSTEEVEEENVCAICLNAIELSEMAMLPCCDHLYCAHCIIHWASHREEGPGTCPQCKATFTELVTYRALDGTLQDFPVQNSLCLLKRAAWYLDRACAHVTPGTDRLSGAGDADEPRPRAETSYDDGDDGGALDYGGYDDDEIEDFYFSSAAGRARVVLGNRRFGEGGYIANGRRQARVTPPNRKMAKSVSGKSAATDCGTPGRSKPLPCRRASWDGGAAAADAATCSSGTPLGTSPSGSGRRAKRSARRAAQDAAVPEPVC